MDSGSSCDCNGHSEQCDMYGRCVVRVNRVRKVNRDIKVNGVINIYIRIRICLFSYTHNKYLQYEMKGESLTQFATCEMSYSNFICKNVSTCRTEIEFTIEMWYTIILLCCNLSIYLFINLFVCNSYS